MTRTCILSLLFLGITFHGAAPTLAQDGTEALAPTLDTGIANQSWTRVYPSDDGSLTADGDGRDYQLLQNGQRYDLARRVVLDK